MREDRYTNAKGLGYLWGIFPFFFLFLLQRQAAKMLRHGMGNEGRKHEDREGQRKENGTGVRVCVCISVRRGDRASPIGGVFIRWKMKYDLLALYHTSISSFIHDESHTLRPPEKMSEGRTRIPLVDPSELGPLR
jgi:hypothetical protein